jgi:hypothetical protein
MAQGGEWSRLNIP